MTVARAPRLPDSSLDLPVTRLWGVGAESAKLFERLEIRTIGDLLWHLPRRYKDYRTALPLAAVRAGAEQTVEAVLGKIAQRRTRSGLLLTEAELLDADGTPSAVRASWFGKQFIAERFREGAVVRLAGKVAFQGRGLVFQQPAMEPAGAAAIHTGRMVPVYKLTEGLKEGQVRRFLHTAIEGEAGRASAVVGELPDLVPADTRARHGLPTIAQALAQVHFPNAPEDLFAARRALGFQELLVLQLALGQRRARWTRSAKAPVLHASDAQVAEWTRALPFSLTAAQVRSFGEVRGDLARTVPMSRLLQGDVGSGKTVVAALAARIAVAAGAQAALMAPTELLAEQHFRSLRGLWQEDGPSLELLSSSTGAARKREILARLGDGSLDIIVGTHALVEDNVTFHRLGLSIVDEQHRFGVRQRATFREKGQDPHLLLTTATPIPQTLSQTLYRDLDVSVIDELPAGRQPIRTEVREPDALPKVWPWLRERVAAGEQAFIVCPRIGGDDDDDDDARGVAATEIARDLERGPLAGLRIGLLHGRLPAKERDERMRRFAAGQLDVLVATTVVEVGIDVPRATVMIVLSAERFGLATLHQLRGRVGRGDQRSFCVLVSAGAAESERLRAMTETKRGADGAAVPLDGFDLARRDLEIRGAGEFLGERQHGSNELRIVDFDDIDPRLLGDTGAEADRILADDPDLVLPDHARLAKAVGDLWDRYALA